MVVPGSISVFHRHTFSPDETYARDVGLWTLPVLSGAIITLLLVILWPKSWITYNKPYGWRRAVHTFVTVLAIAHVLLLVVPYENNMQIQIDQLRNVHKELLDSNATGARISSNISVFEDGLDNLDRALVLALALDPTGYETGTSTVLNTMENMASNAIKLVHQVDPLLPTLDITEDIHHANNAIETTRLIRLFTVVFLVAAVIVVGAGYVISGSYRMWIASICVMCISWALVLPSLAATTLGADFCVHFDHNILLLAGTPAKTLPYFDYYLGLSETDPFASERQMAHALYLEGAPTVQQLVQLHTANGAPATHTGALQNVSSAFSLFTKELVDAMDRGDLPKHYDALHHYVCRLWLPASVAVFWSLLVMAFISSARDIITVASGMVHVHLR